MTINSRQLLTGMLLSACTLSVATTMAAAPEPDVIVMPDAVGAGLPIGAVLVSDAAMAIVDLPGVNGIGASQCKAGGTTAAAGVDCIVVYVSNAAAALQLPKTLGTYPVVAVEAGPIETGP